MLHVVFSHYHYIIIYHPSWMNFHKLCNFCLSVCNLDSYQVNAKGKSRSLLERLEPSGWQPTVAMFKCTVGNCCSIWHLPPWQIKSRFAWVAPHWWIGASFLHPGLERWWECVEEIGASLHTQRQYILLISAYLDVPPLQRQVFELLFRTSVSLTLGKLFFGKPRFEIFSQLSSCFPQVLLSCQAQPKKEKEQSKSNTE